MASSGVVTGHTQARRPSAIRSKKPVNSWKVPYVPGFTNGWQEDRKGSGGDVEIMRQRDDCADVVVKDIRCPEVVGGAYTLDVEITHQVAGTNVQYLQLKPCPAASLPPGAVTVQPLPSLIQTLTLACDLSQNGSGSQTNGKAGDHFGRRLDPAIETGWTTGTRWLHHAKHIRRAALFISSSPGCA